MCPKVEGTPKIKVLFEFDIIKRLKALSPSLSLHMAQGGMCR